MTKEEAQKELADLIPKEEAAWKKLAVVEQERNNKHARLLAEAAQVYPSYSERLGELSREWGPLHKRKELLQHFLEVA